MNKLHGTFFGLVVMTVFILSTFWVFPEKAVAAPIINSSYRIVIAESVTDGMLYEDSFATGTWDESVSLGNPQNLPSLNVTQTSTIEAGSPFFAQGSVGTNGFYTEDQRAVGRSTYIVDFSLLTNHTYSLTATTTVNMIGGYAHSGFSVSNYDTGLFVLGGPPLPESLVDFSDTGVLEAGRYVLEIAALLMDLGLDSSDSSYGGDVNYNITLALSEISDPSPVPEPGTLLLLGSGLAGLALYRRRMNKA